MLLGLEVFCLRLLCIIIDEFVRSEVDERFKDGAVRRRRERTRLKAGQPLLRCSVESSDGDGWTSHD